MLRSSSNRGFLSTGLDNSTYLGGEGDKWGEGNKREEKEEKGREENGKGKGGRAGRERRGGRGRN